MKVPVILLEQEIVKRDWRALQVFLLLKAYAKSGYIAIDQTRIDHLAHVTKASTRTIERAIRKLKHRRWIFTLRSGKTVLNGWERISERIEHNTQRSKTDIEIIPEKLTIDYIKGLSFGGCIHMLAQRTKARKGKFDTLTAAYQSQRKPTLALKFQKHSNAGLSKIYGMSPNMILAMKKRATKANTVDIRPNYHSIQMKPKDALFLKKYTTTKTGEGGPICVVIDDTGANACYRLPDYFASKLS